MLHRRLLPVLSLVTAAWCSSVSPLTAADQKLETALGFTPFQENVLIDKPTPAEVEKCRLNPVNETNITGWSVVNEAGQRLRRFVDTNGDKKLDQWRYYRNGVEVYRDIDSDFDGKPDQYRWLGPAGTRWGLDVNEDSRIETWKQISAEEVTAEVVAAIRDRDKLRFQAVLLAADEIQDEIGIGPKRAEQMLTRARHALEDFDDVAKRQTRVTASTRWIHFGGSRPSVIPAGTDGSTKDLMIYDNVSAIVSDEGEDSQIAIGTLIRVGETWKVLELPATLADAQDSSGYFFQASMELRPDLTENGSDGGRKDLRKWIDRLDELDEQLSNARPGDRGLLNDRRGDVIEELINETEGADRKVWTRQFADTVSAAVQSGTYPEGTARLAEFYRKLVRDPDAKSELAYVKYQLISAQYAVSLQGNDVDYVKVQEAHHKNLEAFVDDFPTSPDTADAMLQLGLTKEFAGKKNEALKWYRRIASDFPQAAQAAKATGAASRLECVGKTIPIRGQTLDGRDFDLAEQKGKVVVVHCWASWCDLCKQDFDALKKAQIKYANKQLSIVGINLDQQAATGQASKTSLRLSWPQVHDAGLDSDLANQLGVLTLPTMYLIDSNGRVVRESLHISELDAELSKLLR